MPDNPHAGTHPKENGRPFDSAALAASIQNAAQGLGRLPSPPQVSEYRDGGHEPKGDGGKG